MTKELETFDRIIDNIPITEMEEKPNYTLEDLSNDTNLIRQALTELDQIKNATPSEALECLEEMYEISCDGRKPEYTLYECIEQFILKAQEQEKVLEIIFEKNVDILELRIFIENYVDKIALNLYNSKVRKDWQLTKEEFNTLKEYFKYE